MCVWRVATCVRVCILSIEMNNYAKCICLLTQAKIVDGVDGGVDDQVLPVVGAGQPDALRNVASYRNALVHAMPVDLQHRHLAHRHRWRENGMV